MNRTDFDQLGIYRLFMPNLEFLFDSQREALDMWMQGLLAFVNQANPSNPDRGFIISGCQISGNTCSAGIICFQGELMLVDAHTIPFSRPLVFIAQETPAPGLTPVDFVDGNPKNVHFLRRARLVADPGGAPSCAGTAAFRLEDVMQDLSTPAYQPQIFPNRINGVLPVISDHFDLATGLGKGRFRRYAICDGRNQTIPMTDRVPVGLGTGDQANMYAVVGQRTRQLTVENLPAHSHSISGEDNHAHGIGTDGSHVHTLQEAGSHNHAASGVTDRALSDVTRPPNDFSGVWTGGGNGFVNRVPVTINVSNGGNHTHGMDTAGGHNHGGGTGPAGAHNHGGGTGSVGEGLPLDMRQEGIVVLWYCRII